MTAGSLLLRPAVKDKPSYVVRVKNNCLWKMGGCLWKLNKTNKRQLLEASADEAGNPKDE
ncbi:MAG: hypothetical protein RID09_29585 [Coleofasciculus sp. G1-WW12-02]|uniref:hypothetical protein n=1 Tax=unclassified Coleofasciculus TaxID=2692782 RepID=UPI003301DA26